MKKFFFVLASLCIGGSAWSQASNHLNNSSTGATFFRATNVNSTNGGIRLGITNGNLGFIQLRENNALRFSTNNIERARLLSTGEFGIGTNSPITLLDVNGQVTVRDLQQADTLDRVVVADPNGTLFYRDAGTIGGGGTDADWLVTGNDMEAIPTGSVGVGVTPSPFVKFFTNDNNDVSLIAGGFYKFVNPTQVGVPIGLRGLVTAMPGTGVGVEGIAQSNESGATATAVQGVARGNNFATIALRGTTEGTSSNLSVGVQAVGAAEAPVQYGVQATSGLSSLNTGFNAGIRSIGFGNNNNNGSNYGLHCTAHPGTATVTNIGVLARAIRPPSNIPGNPNVNYGLFAFADTDGITNRAAYLDGDVDITGTLNNPSDAKLKDNVNNIESAVELLQQLHPKTYKYKDNIPYLNLPDRKQYGFIAQELEKVMPELVSQSVRPAIYAEDNRTILAEEFEYKSVSYTGLIPLLVQAVKELQATNEELKNEIDNLRLGSVTQNIGVPGVLHQNIPNPFTEITTIRFEIADRFQEGSLFIYDMNGAQIDRISIGPGDEEIEIEGNRLKAGMYLYSLIVDGREIDTKRMILTK